MALDPSPCWVQRHFLCLERDCAHSDPQQSGDSSPPLANTLSPSSVVQSSHDVRRRSATSLPYPPPKCWLAVRQGPLLPWHVLCILECSPEAKEPVLQPVVLPTIIGLYVGNPTTSVSWKYRFPFSSNHLSRFIPDFICSPSESLQTSRRSRSLSSRFKMIACYGCQHRKGIVLYDVKALNGLTPAGKNGPGYPPC